MAMKASYIIYILFILLPNVVTMAQSVESDELFSKGVHLYNMKKYKEAIPIFQESDRLDKIEMDSTHNRRDYSAMWLASCHYQLGDEKQAQKISPYYYKLSPIDRRLTIQSDSLSALADKAFEHQDYTKALKLYKQCDAIEATILGKNHIWRMTTIANEGYRYSQLSDSTNAIKCFEAHQAACQQLYNLECDAAMNTLFALGHEYYNHQFENHYPKALNAYFQAYELAKNLNDSINYNSSLYCISLCYFSQSQENNGDEQGKYLENAEVFVRELRNDNEEDRYLKNLIYDNLANFYNKKSEEYLQDSITLQQALDYSQKALETYQKKPDADQGVKRLLEIYKMDCLIRSNKIQEAIELGEDLYAAFLPIRQQESENYQTLLQNLSYSYKVLGNEEKNIFYLNLLSTSYTQSNQTQNEKILDVFYELSQAYYRTSQYKEALHYAKTAKKICNREIYPKKYPYILFNLAQAYLENEQTNNSLACINEILSITQPDVDIYIHALRLKTSAYNYIDSSQALDACLQCIKPAKKLYGEHSSFYRALLYDIANLYYNLGDAFSALQYAEEEMRLNQQYADTLDIIYLRNQTTLANLYSHYDLGKSAAYFTSVVRKITHNEFLTEQHWTYLQWPMEERISELLFLIQVFNNIFDTITSLPDMENNPEYCTQMDSTRNEFLRLWNKSARNFEANIPKTTSNSHTLRASICNSLATTYYTLSMKDEALDYATKAMVYVPRKNKETYSSILSDAAFIYYKYGLYDKMITPLKISHNIDKSMLVNTFRNVPKSVRERYLAMMQSSYNFIIEAAEHTQMKELCSMAYDVNLFLKGLMLNTDIEFEKLIYESGNDSLQTAYNKWRDLSLFNDRLSKQDTQDSLFSDSLMHLEQELEYRLIRESKKYGSYVKGYSTTWKEIWKGLKKDDIAIEFCTYYSNNTEEYAAVLLEKKSKYPTVVRLFSQKQLSTIPTTDYYNTTALSNLIWKPLHHYLAEKKNVYFSPSGELNNIAIEYIPLTDKKTFAEYYNTYRLSSTRELIKNKREDIRTKAVLYGGLEYERGQGDIEAMRKELQSAESLIAFRDVPEIDSLVLRKGISFLEGTEREVQTIDTLLRNKQIPVALMSGMAGTEESFKQLSGQSITLLHVATHGFYSPLTGHYTAQRSFEEQALSRSGLFLSGAAASLNMKKIPEDIEDGILTAKELSKLDLSNLNLAILSACQTGLGEIVGDGVFGLQRGFKKAGAQTLLMSLWKVDDTATQLLMAEFYKNLVSGQNKRAAFLNAQKYLRSYQNGIYDKPEYWAAFIMLDGIH